MPIHCIGISSLLMATLMHKIPSIKLAAQNPRDSLSDRCIPNGGPRRGGQCLRLETLLLSLCRIERQSKFCLIGRIKRAILCHLLGLAAIKITQWHGSCVQSTLFSVRSPSVHWVIVLLVSPKSNVAAPFERFCRSTSSQLLE